MYKLSNKYVKTAIIKNAQKSNCQTWPLLKVSQNRKYWQSEDIKENPTETLELENKITRIKNSLKECNSTMEEAVNLKIGK